jgi:hypothetical protein
MIAFTNAKGEPDILSMEEFQAVEVSGRSDWQHYAMVPVGWPERISIARAFMTAHLRPGAVKDGQRPSHVEFTPMNKHGLPHLGTPGYKYHLADSWTCQVMQRPGLHPKAMLDRQSFARAIKVGLACAHCMNGVTPRTHAA